MKPATNSTSCSTSRIAKPCSACTSRRVRARSAVSCAVEPRRRLVEQQHRRLGHQRPPDLDQPALAEAEVLDRLVGDVAEPEQRRAPRRSARSRRRAACPSPIRSFQSRPSPRRTRSAISRCSRTVELGEQLDALERAADAAPGPLGARAGRLTSSPSSSTVPRSGRSTPSTQLKNVVLPAPFGPISPTRSPASTVEVDVVEGDDAGERLADVVASQHRGHRRPAPRRSARRRRRRRRRRSPSRGRRRAASASVRRAACALAVLDQPSGWRAYWMVPSPNRMKRHCGDIGKTPGMPLSPRRIHSKSAPFSTIGVEQAEGDAGLDRALDVRDAEGDDEHQPEQRRERREVAGRSSRSPGGCSAWRRRGRR